MIPLDEEFVETAKCRQFSGRRGFGVMMLSEVGHMAANRVYIGSDDRRVDVNLCLGLCRGSCFGRVFPRICGRSGVMAGV